MLTREKLLLLMGGAKVARTITPSFGVELHTDPGLEGTYTDGLNAWFAKGGTPTVVQSADVHGGSKAQEFTPVAVNNLIAHGTIPSVVGFAKLSFWAKRTAGASGLVKVLITSTFGNIRYGPGLSYADWTLCERTYRENGYGDFYIKNFDASVFDTVIVDDFSHKKLTLATAFATPKNHASDAIVRAGVTVPAYYQGGVAMNINNVGNPTYGVLGYVDGGGLGVTSTYLATLDQCINGVWTRLIHTAITYVAGAVVEVRNVGTTYQLWYNGAQVGTDQTINDATLRAGTIATQFATSPNVIFGSYQP